MTFAYALGNVGYNSCMQQVGDRSVWCNLLPQASSPGISVANCLCESAAEFLVTDDLLRDLAIHQRKDPVFSSCSVFVSGSGQESQPPMLTLLVGMGNNYQTYCATYEPSIAQLHSRLNRAEEEKRDLETRVALVRQVQRVESEVRLLRNELSKLCGEIGPSVSYCKLTRKP